MRGNDECYKISACMIHSQYQVFLEWPNLRDNNRAGHAAWFEQTQDAYGISC
jgi:hypothetical protein